MKKESIIVVYDYNQTVAEEISNMLTIEIFPVALAAGKLLLFPFLSQLA